MHRLSKAQLDSIISVDLGWLKELLVEWWTGLSEYLAALRDQTLSPRVMEVMVGVALMVVSVAAVGLFVCLCWGIVWKLLLSRLGLFRELVSNNGSGSEEQRPKSILVRHRSPRPHPRRVEIREPAKEELHSHQRDSLEEEEEGEEGEDEGGKDVHEDSRGDMRHRMRVVN